MDIAAALVHVCTCTYWYILVLAYMDGVAVAGGGRGWDVGGCGGGGGGVRGGRVGRVGRVGRGVYLWVGSEALCAPSEGGGQGEAV